MLKRGGNLARMTLRGLENVSKRYLIHAAAYNLGLLMRVIFGQGTPKGMADALCRLILGIFAIFATVFALILPEISIRQRSFLKLTDFSYGCRLRPLFAEI